MKICLKKYIRENPDRTIVATWSDGHSTECVEVAAVAGFDLIFFDAEHGCGDNPNYASLVRTAEAAGIIPMFRIPTAHSEEMIKRFLDIGASGILAPNVHTKEDAKAAVRYSKFAPLGERGCCPFYRSNDFGEKYGQVDYYAKANEEVTTMVLIESVEGYRNFDEIIAVEGVDAVMFGRVDMASSMGKPGQYNDPELNRMLVEMIEKASRKNIITGMFCVDAADSQQWKAYGLNFVTTPGDRVLLLRAMKQTVQEMRGRKG